jgi:hypothetical protein
MVDKNPIGDAVNAVFAIADSLLRLLASIPGTDFVMQRSMHRCRCWEVLQIAR